jgi:hypothetical protein
MGDHFNVGPGSSFVNKSTLTNSPVSSGHSGAGELSATLVELAHIVHGSKEPEAVEAFEIFASELGRPDPNKKSLRMSYRVLESVLPQISENERIQASINRFIQD